MAETAISPQETLAVEENQQNWTSRVDASPKKKVRIYNLTSFKWTEENLSFLLLGPKFVPITQVDMVQLKIDILSFSRKLMLKAHFHNTEYNDNSLIKPPSNFIPKSTKYPILRSVINDLEVFANELEHLEKRSVPDNLTPDQREGLKLLQKNKQIVYFNSDKGAVPVLLYFATLWHVPLGHF